MILSVSCFCFDVVYALVVKHVNGNLFVYWQELEDILDLDSLSLNHLDIPPFYMFNEHINFGFGISDVGNIDVDNEQTGFGLGEEEEEVVPRRVWKPTL